MKKTKNKEGFTLVELLAVIVLLALILVIATTTVTKTIKSNRAKALSNNMVSVTESVKTILSGNNGIEKDELIKKLSKNLSCSVVSVAGDKEIKCEQFTIRTETSTVSSDVGGEIKNEVTGYKVVISPNNFSEFKNMNENMFKNDDNNVKKFIYYLDGDIPEICAVFNTDGSVADTNGSAADCDAGKGKKIASSLDKPGIGSGDSPAVTSIAEPSSPEIKVPSQNDEEEIKIIEKSFSCCPANDSDGGYHDNETARPPYYSVVNGVKYCKKDYATFSPLKDSSTARVSYLEGRKSFVGVGALGEKWFGRDENIYATMMCTPTKENTNYSFSIEEILSSAGHSDAETVEECISKGYCTKMDNIKRDIKRYSLGEDVYGLVVNRKLAYDETKHENKNFRWEGSWLNKKYVWTTYTYTEMRDSYTLLAFNKKDIKEYNGKQTIKELYFAFLISDDEWERKINNLTIHGNATPYRKQIHVFSYGGRKYRADLYEQTENGIVSMGYGLQ